MRIRQGRKPIRAHHVAAVPANAEHVVPVAAMDRATHGSLPALKAHVRENEKEINETLVRSVRTPVEIVESQSST
jgi:hypothetical protein